MKRKERIEGAVYEQHYIYNLHYHLIWVTKYRKPVFTDDALVQEMKDILQREASMIDVTIEEMEVMPDHIHLLLSFKPKYAITDVVKAFKGHSGRVFLKNHPEIKHDNFWGGHIWSHSYYVGSCGKMSRDVVEKYIRNQCSK